MRQSLMAVAMVTARAGSTFIESSRRSSISGEAEFRPILAVSGMNSTRASPLAKWYVTSMEFAGMGGVTGFAMDHHSSSAARSTAPRAR
jgi:hypothetical protein